MKTAYSNPLNERYDAHYWLQLLGTAGADSILSSWDGCKKGETMMTMARRWGEI
jgi:hypothetical protein